MSTEAKSAAPVVGETENAKIAESKPAVPQKRRQLATKPARKSAPCPNFVDLSAEDDAGTDEAVKKANEQYAEGLKEGYSRTSPVYFGDTERPKKMHKATPPAAAAPVAAAAEPKRRQLATKPARRSAPGCPVPDSSSDESDSETESDAEMEEKFRAAATAKKEAIAAKRRKACIATLRPTVPPKPVAVAASAAELAAPAPPIAPIPGVQTIVKPDDPCVMFILHHFVNFYTGDERTVILVPTRLLDADDAALLDRYAKFSARRTPCRFGDFKSKEELYCTEAVHLLFDTLAHVAQLEDPTLPPPAPLQLDEYFTCPAIDVVPRGEVVPPEKMDELRHCLDEAETLADWRRERFAHAVAWVRPMHTGAVRVVHTVLLLEDTDQ